MIMQPIRTLIGPAAALPLANVDTDQIIPARFMSRSRAEGYGGQCFHDLRFDEDGRPRDGFPLNTLSAAPKVLVTDDNFGCGSSREAAVYALLDYGVAAVIAPGFADIFRSNAGKNGLLAITLPEADVRSLRERLIAEPGIKAIVALPEQRVSIGDYAFSFEIDPRLKHCLLNGLDDLSATLEERDRIEAFEEVYFATRNWVMPNRA